MPSPAAPRAVFAADGPGPAVVAVSAAPGAKDFLVALAYRDREWITTVDRPTLVQLHASLKLRMALQSHQSSSLHFPQHILPGRSHPEDGGAGLIRDYLEHLLHHPVALNHPKVLEMLSVSTFSFDPRYRASLWEGWCLLETRDAHDGDLEWHTIRVGRVVLGCACFPASSHGFLPRRFWLVHKPGFIAFLHRPLDEHAVYVITLAPGVLMKKGFSQSGGHRHVIYSTTALSADVRFYRREDKKRYVERVEQSVSGTATASHRYSGGPVRNYCDAEFLIDGNEYFSKVADAIEGARRDVFIQGWWVCADVRLKREQRTVDEDYWSLSRTLQRACNRGVMVRVLMYGEVQLVLSLASKLQQARLGSHARLVVLRHPVHANLNIPLYWSHHEKVVVVDCAQAFVGGIDLAWGRYDWAEHRLFGSVWQPLIDYTNPRLRDITDAKRIDACSIGSGLPRMPWHDVAVLVRGDVAVDVARHFAQQWSFAALNSNPPVGACAVDLPMEGGVATGGAAEAQLLRSLPEWSGGGDEQSIHRAYVDLIGSARNLCYIENQFFQSGIEGDAHLGNRVVNAIYARLVRALKTDMGQASETTNDDGSDDVRFLIVLPLLPAFEGAVNVSDSIRSILHWQLRTLCKGEQSLTQRLLRTTGCSAAQLDDRLLVVGLRTFDSPGGPDATLVSEMVYVHSKVMIVDDECALVGSANINDRSMLGSRDSEATVLVRDAVSVTRLRQRLFAEHFGLGESEAVFTLEAFRALRAQAHLNGKIFEKVFGITAPSNSIRSFRDLQQTSTSSSTTPAAVGLPDDSWFKSMSRVKSFNEAQALEPEEAVDDDIAENVEMARLRMRLGGGWGPDAVRLLRIKGRAVLWPLFFLCDEPDVLASSPLSALIGAHVYQ